MLLLVTGFAALAKAQDTTKVKKTPDERAAQMGKMMQKRLNLTADQSKQIDAILIDRAEKLDAMKGQKGSRNERMKLMTDADTRINAILNDDQKKQYAQMKEKILEKRGGLASAPANANTPPPAP
jgi:protein CpxP